MLVVENQPAVLDVVCEIVKDAGYHCTCVGNGLDAFRSIPELPTLSALVVDVNLGDGANGYEIARFSRQVIEDLPIVYISGESTREMFEVFGEPQSQYLAKPFSDEQLRDALTETTSCCAKKPASQ